MRRLLALALTVSLAPLVQASQPATGSAETAFGFDNVSVDQTLVFDVLLNERPIGSHSFELSQQDERLRVVSDVDMSVRLLFVEVFSYQHRAEEIWQGDCLSSLTSSTRQNGQVESVAAQLTGAGFEIQAKADGAPTSEVVVAAEPCVGGYAYWDLDRLQRTQLLNAQKGALDPVELTEVPATTLTWLPELAAPARTFELVSNGATITLWYDRAGQWLGLKTLQDGRWLEYRRNGPIAATDRSSELAQRSTAALLPGG